MWTTSRNIAAPAGAVWAALTSLSAWPRWGPTVVGAELDGGGPLRLGARGTVWTPVGVPLPFEITEFVPDQMWGWKVAGVPATKHGVTPDGALCRVWMSSPLWAPGYLPVLAVALRRIEAMVG